MNASTKTTTPSRFVAPLLGEEDTLRVVARHDATAKRRRVDAGFQQGYADGVAAGSASVEEAIADHRRNAERLTMLCGALDAATRALGPHEEEAIRMIESAVVELSLRVAEAVIDREVTDHGLVADTIARALRVSPRSEDTVISLHPDDLECARDAFDAGLVGAHPLAELVADPSISRGGCVVQAGGTRVDAQVDAAAARIREALGAI